MCNFYILKSIYCALPHIYSSKSHCILAYIPAYDEGLYYTVNILTNKQSN